MRISPATTALRNNLGSIDPDTRVDAFLRPDPADKKVALRVVGLTKRYGTTTAVNALNFEIREGEIFGLLGPNGAGKTTTIAMLATQHLPSSGDATLFGHSASKDPFHVRQLIGLAPQEVSLYPALTAAENLQFFGRIYGVRHAELRERIDELLALVGLDAHRDCSGRHFLRRHEAASESRGLAGTSAETDSARRADRRSRPTIA